MQFTSNLSRRQFLQKLLATSAGMAAVSVRPRPLRADQGAGILDIGSRGELFVDNLLIGQLVGEARQQLQHPAAREIALRHEEPWEGTGSGYHSIFQDGDLYPIREKGTQFFGCRRYPGQVKRHPAKSSEIPRHAGVPAASRTTEGY